MLDVQLRHSRYSVVSVLVQKSFYVLIPECKNVFQALFSFLLAVFFLGVFLSVNGILTLKTFLHVK